MTQHSIIEHRANTSTAQSNILCWQCGQPNYYRNKQKTELCYSCHLGLMNKIVRQKKRARVKGNEATLTTAQWVEKLRASQGYCHYCHTFIGFRALTLEHIIPIAKGGGTTAENCVPACMDCNWNSWVSV